MPGTIDKTKTGIDAMSSDIVDAQYEINRLQDVVSSLTLKLTNMQAMLTAADKHRANALNNKTFLDQLIQAADNVNNNAVQCAAGTKAADDKILQLATGIKELLDKLVYSAEIVDKLSIYITKQKALNPLIQDELITMLGKAVADANNAVALALVALNSCFAAYASNKESSSIRTMIPSLTTQEYEILTGYIKTAIYTKNEDAQTAYRQLQLACNESIEELNDATTLLNKAEVKLKSLQAGYAVATATALTR